MPMCAIEFIIWQRNEDVTYIIKQGLKIKTMCLKYILKFRNTNSQFCKYI